MRHTLWITTGAVLVGATFAVAQPADDPPNDPPALGERAFRALDADGDGRITMDEFRRQAPRLMQRARRQGGMQRGMARGMQRGHPAGVGFGQAMPDDFERRVVEIVDRQLREFAQKHLPGLGRGAARDNVGAKAGKPDDAAPFRGPAAGPRGRGAAGGPWGRGPARGPRGRVDGPPCQQGPPFGPPPGRQAGPPRAGHGFGPPPWADAGARGPAWKDMDYCPRGAKRTQAGNWPGQRNRRGTPRGAGAMRGRGTAACPCPQCGWAKRSQGWGGQRQRGGAGSAFAPPGAMLGGPRRRAGQTDTAPPGKAPPRDDAPRWRQARPGNGAFGQIDANGDGRIQARELEAARDRLDDLIRKAGGRDITPDQWNKLAKNAGKPAPKDEPNKRKAAERPRRQQRSRDREPQ